MKSKALLIPLITPLLIGCGGGGVSHTYSPVELNKAQSQIKEMHDRLRHSDEKIKEYTININFNREYYDGIRHTYETLTLEVDLADYKIHLKDIKDDNNGDNHFIGDGDFWFWLDPADDFAYHIDMINQDCEKVVHDVIRKSPDENYGLLLLKASIGYEDEVYDNPQKTSKDNLKAFDGLLTKIIADPAHFANIEFQAYENEVGDLAFNIVHNYDQEKYPGFEFTEYYEFVGDLLMKEEYYSNNSSYHSLLTVTYSLDPIEIVIPDYH